MSTAKNNETKAKPVPSGGSLSSRPAGGSRAHSAALVVLTLVLPLLVGFLLVDRIGRWAGCGDFRSRYAASPAIELRENADPQASVGAATHTPSALKFVVAPVVTPRSSLRLYTRLSAYLEKWLQQPIELMPRGSYAAVNALLRNNECDFAFVCTFPFVVGEHDFGLRAIAIPQIAGKHVYHSYIIVRQGVRARSLLDLRYRRFVSADILSNTGWVYPKYWLKRRSVDVSTFFSVHALAGSHDRAIKAIVNGEADGAAVDSIVYDRLVRGDPAIARRARVIQTSPPFGMPPLVAAPGLDPRTFKRIQQALLHAHLDKSGKAALRVLGFDRFVVPRREIYDSVRTMSRELGTLR